MDARRKDKILIMMSNEMCPMGEERRQKRR